MKVSIKKIVYSHVTLIWLLEMCRRLVNPQVRQTWGAKFKRTASEKNTMLIRIYEDFIKTAIWSACLPDEYLSLRLYGVAREEIADFYSYCRMLKYLSSLKTAESMRIFNDKAEFCQRFSSYLGREVLLWDEQTSLDTVKSFLSGRERVIAKPRQASGGTGIFLIDTQMISDLSEIQAEVVKHGGILLEECLVNHQNLKQFSKEALSTVRIITLKHPEYVQVLGAFLRFNPGPGITDNLSGGGCASPIDPASGKIYRGIVDVTKDTIGTRHPTGFEVIGYQLPYWPETLRLVEQAAQELADVRFTPWDVAITDKGPYLIEGNNECGSRFQRIVDRNCYEDIKTACRG